MTQLYTNKQVAIVLDDDEDTRFAISRILGKCDCEVLEASSVEAAVELIQENSVNVVFSDMRIPGAAGGEELLDITTKNHPGVHVVLMSCAMDAAAHSRLMNAGAFECLQKPFYKDTCMQILSSIKEPLQKSA